MAKYKIKKGKHYNASKVRFLISLLFGLVNGEVIRRTFLLHLSRTMTRYVYFSKECWYTKDELDKDESGKPLTGWNKLFGFFGFLIHMFSGRLVWQPVWGTPGLIEVGLYVYSKGDWIYEHIANVMVGTLNKMGIKASSGYLESQNYYEGFVYVNGRREYDITLAEKTPHFLKAEPYFGGQSGAVRTMNIYLYNQLTYKLFKKWIHKRHGL